MKKAKVFAGLLLMSQVLFFFSCAGGNTTTEEKEVKPGELLNIYYPTKDYTVPEGSLTNEDYYEKHANVYLPAGYDKDNKSKKYPLVILLHGMGCNENTWGLQDPESPVTQFLDKEISSGKIKKCIIVSADGIADKSWGPDGWANSLSGCNAFGQELRNDLLPYLKNNFNILDGRENVALAGFSMGAEQTMNLGIGECLDLIAYFGAFGACPHAKKGDPDSETLAPAIYINEVENRFSDNELTIRQLYIAVGSDDNQFRPGCEAYSQAMATWNRVEHFGYDAVEGKQHEWDVWFFGLTHFMPLVF